MQPRHAPSPAFGSTGPPSGRPTAPQRGRMLLDFLSASDLVILNGRFQSRTCPPIPFTCQRWPSTSIVDYVLISKCHFKGVESCRVLPRSRSGTRTTRRQSGKFPADHNPIILILRVSSKSKKAPTAIPEGDGKGERIQFHTSKLKDPKIKDAYVSTLEKESSKILPKLEALSKAMEDRLISPSEFADQGNELLVGALQAAADKVLGRITTRSPHPGDKPRTTVPIRLHLDELVKAHSALQMAIQIGAPASEVEALRGKYRSSVSKSMGNLPNSIHHSDPDPKGRALQRNFQKVKNDLAKAKAADPGSDATKDLQAEYRTARTAWLKLANSRRQDTLTNKVQSREEDETCDQPARHPMWMHLRSYKNDHAQSGLPKEVCSNKSGDKRVWQPGPLSACALVWHQFRHALGHHLFRHPDSPYDEAARASVLDSLKNVVVPAVALSRPFADPLFEAPFGKEEVEAQHKIGKEKSPGDDGVSNGMMKHGGVVFQAALLLLLNGIWVAEVQTVSWQMSLLNPIYKSGGKPKADPASYRGIYLSSAIAKLFEGILISRLTRYTELHNTLTHSQLGTRPGRQIHDAIYSLLAIIQYQAYAPSLKPSYVAFIDYSTAFPSVFRHKLMCLLFNHGILGRMWMHLRARIWSIKIRVLHPGIPASEKVDILRGLPEGSRLSPTLFGIFAADLITDLRRTFPDATVTLGPKSVWTGGLLYVDDLCLIATSATQLQEMLDVCQIWSERSRIQINASKSKVMIFHEPAGVKAARLKTRVIAGQKLHPTPFHIRCRFPLKAPCSIPLRVVDEFDYLGLRIDTKFTMKPAVKAIQKKANQAHALVSAVLYSLRYDKCRFNPTAASDSPVSRIVQLWKSLVLPHFLLYLRYLPEQQVDILQISLNRSLKRCLHVYGEDTAILADIGIPPLRIYRLVQLAQFRFRLRYSAADSIPHSLWAMWHSRLLGLGEHSLEQQMEGAVRALDVDRLPLDSPLPQSVLNTIPTRREKSYKPSSPSRPLTIGCSASAGSCRLLPAA